MIILQTALLFGSLYMYHIICTRRALRAQYLIALKEIETNEHINN